ncbi:VOC family protein [archaeon]|nr:VOC family protein [archaeon]
MSKVVHFDIEAEDPQKLADFYGKVFDWKFNKFEGPQDYWLIKTGDKEEQGIDGGLSRKGQGNPVNTIGVSDIDEFIQKIIDNGGNILVQKMPIPGVGWLAYFKDPEGNSFGIMQDDESAK